MTTHSSRVPVLILGALFATLATAPAADPATKPAAAVATNKPPRKYSQAPLELAPGQKPVSTHTAYSDNKQDCGDCHQNKDPKNPGKIKGDVKTLCLECHEDTAKILTRKFKHKAADDDCLSCHNAHDSKFPKLLHADLTSLCYDCHDKTKALIANSPVKHDAVTMDKQCLNCHETHASTNQFLLAAPAFDLCAKCHNKDGVKDDTGKTLLNFKTLLAENKYQHGPVAARDCVVCHDAHAATQFRLLTNAYPATFYAPGDSALYANCFECHEETLMTEQASAKATQFRNGTTNLHFLHLNQPNKGRTCRACHDVHASRQPHQIRDAVPFGKRGWMLPINYTATPVGGSCDRTCHSTRSYTNKIAPVITTPVSAKPAPLNTNLPPAAPK